MLEFHGRRDLQVKIRGYRLELAEVENVLKRHPAIADAAAIAVPADNGARRLAAFYVATSDVGPDELRRLVEQSLPAFAVPSTWTRVPSLPLNANGKVDRRKLAIEIESVRPPHDARRPGEGARGDLTEVFETSRIDRESNFFELGGHSLPQRALRG